MIPRQQFCTFLRDNIGLPYIWGGNGPETYDCSGLICAALRVAGVNIGDHSALDIYNMFHDRVVPEYSREGQLFFYGTPVSHVMAGIRYWGKGRGYLVGARGGGHTTATVDIAWSQKACVDMVRSDYWRNNMTAILDPWEE